MRARLTISLLLILTLPFAATWGWLQMTRIEIQKDVAECIRSGADTGRYVTLRITHAESVSVLEWRESDEFEYEGMLYDIVGTEIQGEYVYYICRPDVEEALVDASLKDLVRKALGESPGNDETRKRLADYLKNLYCDAHGDMKISLRSLQIVRLPDHNNMCRTSAPTPPTPPPDLS